MKVLLIEDDPGIIDVVTLTLELRWSDVNLTSTFSGEKGVELARTELPDLIILDLGLPDTDGFQVLRRIRGFCDVPVVILTVRGEELDKIKGLEMGADDYIIKPFSPGELLARMQALLRRSQMTEAGAKVGDRPSIRGKLRVDFSSREVSLGDKILKLSPREYDLLYHLMTNEGKVLSNETLLAEIFPEHGADIKFLKVYINRLKEQLEMDPSNPTMIVNEGDMGYKFVGG
ncbi:response regulator transcription factor [Chloroflexota bacterium]